MWESGDGGAINSTTIMTLNMCETFPGNVDKEYRHLPRIGKWSKGCGQEL